MPRWNRFENFGSTIEHADSGRGAHFVTGERKEVASEFLNIERHVPDALRRINKSDCANSARFLAEIDDRIDRSEGIRNLSEGKHFHFGRKQRRKFFEREGAVVANRNEPQLRANSFAEQLPGHKVAVVLHLGEQNHVTGAETFSAPSLRDQINALSCAAGEYDLVRARRADEISHALPGFFVMLGRAHTQCVQAAMHVGVFMFVITSDDIEDGARLLGGGGVVEVNQGMAVDALPQNWKILAKRGPIHATYGRLVHEIICSKPWLAPLYSQGRGSTSARLLIYDRSPKERASTG